MSATAHWREQVLREALIGEGKKGKRKKLFQAGTETHLADKLLVTWTSCGDSVRRVLLLLLLLLVVGVVDEILPRRLVSVYVGGLRRRRLDGVRALLLLVKVSSLLFAQRARWSAPVALLHVGRAHRLQLEQ